MANTQNIAVVCVPLFLALLATIKPEHNEGILEVLSKSNYSDD
jgi:hypothetical protein